MNDREAIYRKYLADLMQKIIDRYESEGRKASGAFESELEVLIEGDKASIVGASHSVFVEKGRRAGKFPPLKNIESWIDAKKGLPQIFYDKKKQYAFLIARKISRVGTQGSEILEPILNDFLNNEFWKMIDEIGDVFASRMSNDIVKLIKKL